MTVFIRIMQIVGTLFCLSCYLFVLSPIVSDFLKQGYADRVDLFLCVVVTLFVSLFGWVIWAFAPR